MLTVTPIGFVLILLYLIGIVLIAYGMHAGEQARNEKAENKSMIIEFGGLIIAIVCALTFVLTNGSLYQL